MAGNLKEHPKVLALAVVSLMVLCVGLAVTYWPTGTPEMPETMEDVPALLESKAYQNLSREQRRPYVERVSQLMRESDREQRRAMMQNSSEASRDAMRDMFRQQMLERVQQFALADAATRHQMIAEDRARFESFGGRGGPGRRSGGGDGSGASGGEGRGDRTEPSDEEREERREQRETRIEQWVNEGNGQDWALIREYMQQVRPPRN